VHMDDKSKNILFVTQNFYPETFGINDIVSDMAGCGYNVDVLTGLPNYPMGRFYDGYGIFKRGSRYYHGARLFRCAVFPRLKNSKIGISLNYASFAICATFKLLRLAFRKYDKVFVYEPSPLFQAIPGLIAAKLKRCEKIIYVLDIWPESVYSVVDIKNKVFRRMLKKYSERTYRKFDRVLVTSRGFVPQFEAAGIERSKITYIPQWSTPMVQGETDEESSQRFKDTFNVVFTGNVGIPQNLSILAQAAQKLADYKDIRYIIVGDGDYLNDFLKLVSDMKLEDVFVFEGRKPQDKMAGYYATADCLFASLKNIELFTKIIPAKIQAYMQSGKPVICSITGEGAQVVDEAGCGLTSDAGDAQALAQNIIKLYNMTDDERRKMGAKGIAYSKEHFDREKLLDQIAQILAQ
jgi:glycosyltransferase involved in cell wall biosynthesis